MWFQSSFKIEINKTLYTCRLNTFSVVLNSFLFSGLKHLCSNKGNLLLLLKKLKSIIFDTRQSSQPVMINYFSHVNNSMALNFLMFFPVINTFKRNYSLYEILTFVCLLSINTVKCSQLLFSNLVLVSNIFSIQVCL